MLTHLHACAHAEIHQFQWLHDHNAETIQTQYNALSKSAPLLNITPSHDRKLPFVELSLPLEGMSETRRFLINDEFSDFLSLSAASIGLGLYYRDSFGFNESTLARIGDKVRLSPGTANPEQLIDFLVGINLDLKEAQQLLQSDFDFQRYLQGANWVLGSSKPLNLYKMNSTSLMGACHALYRATANTTDPATALSTTHSTETLKLQQAMQSELAARSIDLSHPSA